MVRASASEAVDLNLIPSRVKPMTLKLVFTASLLDVQALKGQCEEQAGKFTCCAAPSGKVLSGIPTFGVVDRWPATPKRARIAH